MLLTKAAIARVARVVAYRGEVSEVGTLGDGSDERLGRAAEPEARRQYEAPAREVGDGLVRACPDLVAPLALVSRSSR